MPIIKSPKPDTVEDTETRIVSDDDKVFGDTLAPTDVAGTGPGWPEEKVSEKEEEGRLQTKHTDCQETEGFSR